MDLEGVKLIVPNNKFDVVLTKFDTPLLPFLKNPVNYFLSERCTNSFIASFVKKFPDHISSLKPDPDYHSRDEALIVRLHQNGMLPELERLRIANELSDIVVDLPRVTFYFEDIHEILDSDEFEKLVNRVRDEMLPNIDNLIDELLCCYDSDEDPDSHFRVLKDQLKELPGLFNYNVEVNNVTDNALADIEHHISELMPEYENSGYSQSLTNESTPVVSQENEHRSIFDDVDS